MAEVFLQRASATSISGPHGRLLTNMPRHLKAKKAEKPTSIDLEDCQGARIQTGPEL